MSCRYGGDYVKEIVADCAKGVTLIKWGNYMIFTSTLE
jgi:hypothetical protein